MTIPVITKAPEKWPLPATRCIFRGHLMDYETAAFIMAAEAELGYQLTVEQGCYNPGGVAASAGTHDGGGVFDLAPWDHDRKTAVTRSLGAQGSWPRLPSQGPWSEHVHAVIGGHPTLSLAARSQVDQFNERPRKNGLANRAVDPDQHPSRPPARVTFHYPPKVPLTPTFVGLCHNDDWENLASDVAGLVADLRPLVGGVQEGYRLRYRSVLPKRWHVKQRRANKAQAGVAVIWDSRRLEHTGISAKPHLRGRGWQPIGKGVDTRIRGVVWRDLQFRPGVNRGAMPPAFRLASVHRPPQRNKASWAAFDQKLRAWVKQSPLPVLLLMDSNEHGGPEELEQALAPRYSWHAADAIPKSIDGALTSLPVRGVKELPKRTSDHHPVVITLG